MLLLQCLWMSRLGNFVEDGSRDATALGEMDRMDADIAAAREARYIAAFAPETQDLNGGNRGSMEVAALMQQLEEVAGERAGPHVCL